jgi:hypothetical protein
MVEERLRQPMWRHTLTILGVLHLIWQFAFWLPLHWPMLNDNRDLFAYYQGAVRAEQGVLLYQAQPNYGPHLIPTGYIYPPPLAALLSPLGRVSLEHFQHFWYLLLLAAFWVYAVCLAQLACGRVTWRRVLVAGLALDLFPGTAVGLSFGNAQQIVAALWGFALLTPSGAWRGLALSLSTLLKLHAAWPLLLVMKEEKSSRVPALAVLIAGVVLGIALCGVQSYFDWWRLAQPVIAQSTFAPGNISFSFAALRLARLLGWQYEAGPLPPLATAYLSATAILAPLLTLFATRKCAPRTRYALVGLAAVFFAPLCWTSYLPLLLAPLALWWRELRESAAVANQAL